MIRATEVYARDFDLIFFKLPPRVREAIEGKIHQLGSRLGDYPHQRLTGRTEYRLRIGDYRVIYEFNREQNVLYLLAVGNRREIYPDFRLAKGSIRARRASSRRTRRPTAGRVRPTRQATTA